MKTTPILAAILAGFLLSVGPVAANVTLPHVFSDHMVLQQGMEVPVWGTASPGEKVTVTFAGQTVTATTAQDGKWMVKLASLKTSADGRELTVTGNNTVKFSDVLVGEVWLASGQSNMDFTVARTPRYYFAGVRNEAAEVKNANYPLIRMFSGDWTKSATPQSDVGGQWKVCTPENVREYSAAAYFFAMYLHKEIKVPVGIITETYGASTAEAWIRREALAADPQLKPMLNAFDASMAAFSPATRATQAQAREKWNGLLAETEKQDVAEWKANPDQPTKTAAPAALRLMPSDPEQNQHNPTVMYNGMIAPIVPYAIKGVIWYQGESIVGGVQGGTPLYPHIQAALVKDWRKLWGQDDLPFYVVQLASLGNGSGSLPEVREAQATILDLPHTGIACSIDIADVSNVHPKDKQNVGYRLMCIALAQDYGRKIEFYGPVYQSMEAKDGKIVLHFTHTGGGLKAKDGEELKWFTIAGADGNFVPAKAAIDQDTVVVSSPDVAAPANVRYAWDKYPVGINFYNGFGLPAFPFRTDKK